MSYETVWGIPYKQLLKTGFRSFNDQAWAGVRSGPELTGVLARAAKLGLTCVVPITRQELGVNHHYTCDMSCLQDRDLGFRWSYIPYSQKGLGRPNYTPSTVSGYGLFATEQDAVIWKLIVGKSV